jgi:Zn-dependent membrane protease YugP
MDAFLTAIVVWLSANFDLPATFNHPKVERVTATQMATLRYGDTENKKGSRQLVAFYNTQKQIIYISDAWTGRTPADLSVVVHEMVHHLQRAARQTYECPAAREKLAFQAQNKWLAQFGRSLESEFQIDRLTILVTTSCAFGMVDPPG